MTPSRFTAPSGIVRAWWRSLRDPGLGLGTRLTLSVLLGGLGLSGFLLYQTIVAQQSHREAVGTGLENLSVLVADRLMVPVVGDWFMAAGRAFAPILPLVEDPDPDALPHPSILSAADLLGGNCRCPLAPEGALPFRFDLRSGAVVFGEAPFKAPHADALRMPLRVVAERPLNDSTFWRFDTRPAGGLILVESAGDQWAVPFVLLVDGDDQPGWFYGFAAPAGPFMEGSLKALPDLAPRLLPREFRAPSEVPILARAELVTTEGGHPLARVEVAVPEGGTPGPATAVAGFQQASILDQVRLTASLHPEFLEWIPVAHAGDDRSLLYLLIVLLNAGLVGVALVQLGREGAFLRRRAEFVAGFSHEARNPLATIRLYVQGLRFGRIVEPEGQDRALDIIDRESRRLVHMVANFLSHGSHEEDALRLTPHPVELADEFRTFAMSVRSEVDERNADLVLEIDRPIWIRTDPTALQQVLRNLVGNALKYGPEGQTIRLGAERRNGALRLWVEDEGPGVPEGERETIFDPFVRTPAGIRSGAGGSGLGLSVVRDLLALQGGIVAVERGRGGRGARFVVRLPLPTDEDHAS